MLSRGQGVVGCYTPRCWRKPTLLFPNTWVQFPLTTFFCSTPTSPFSALPMADITNQVSYLALTLAICSIFCSIVNLHSLLKNTSRAAIYVTFLTRPVPAKWSRPVLGYLILLHMGLNSASHSFPDMSYSHDVSQQTYAIIFSSFGVILPRYSEPQHSERFHLRHSTAFPTTHSTTIPSQNPIQNSIPFYKLWSCHTTIPSINNIMCLDFVHKPFFAFWVELSVIFTITSTFWASATFTTLRFTVRDEYLELEQNEVCPVLGCYLTCQKTCQI